MIYKYLMILISKNKQIFQFYTTLENKEVICLLYALGFHLFSWRALDESGDTRRSCLITVDFDGFIEWYELCVYNIPLMS
jgi:hypothetical protein